MNQFPLTPPMDSLDVSFSPASGSSSSPPSNSMNYGTSFNPLTFKMEKGTTPYLSIVEEPVERFRFRYKSEMAGTHGSLLGRFTSRGRKQSFPSVELHNFNRPATIRCSLYQYGPPNLEHLRKPHAHRLVKKVGVDECDDPHNVEVCADIGYTANFHSMGIIHTAKKFVVGELTRKNTLLKKEEIARECGFYRPLNKKEEYAVKELAERESRAINLNIVCLRFEAFEVIDNIYHPICVPIYSNTISNLKSALTGDLKIVRMDHCSSPCKGGREIFIFVEKVTKQNINIRFYELDDDNEISWSANGKFSAMDVHHQYAIAFKTPAYHNQNLEKQVKVFIELERPSDGSRSEPKEFTYTPCETTMGRKRTRYQESYDSYSNSFSSNELPVPILTMNGSENQALNWGLEVNSDDLAQALTKGLNSEEFEKICHNLGLYNNSIPDFYSNCPENICMDGPTSSTIDIKPKINSGSFYERFIPTLKPSEKGILKRVETELVAFIKTEPTKERLYHMFNHFFSNQEYISDDYNSILHLLLMENDSRGILKLFLQYLLNVKTGSVINDKNNKGKTPLHVAVEFDNHVAVDCLLHAKADVCIQDHEGNTALHLAILNNAQMSIMKLLCTEAVVNTSNFEGLAPLHLAVKCNNLHAVQLLWLRGADMNSTDQKNGRTSLHMAVQEEQIEIVNFLLGKPDIVPDSEDFAGCTAFKLAQLSIDHEKPNSIEIYNVLESLMKKNGNFEEINIKEEFPGSSDDDTMDCVDYEIKTEPLSPNSVRQKYAEVHYFTEDCLNELCELLDKSGTWQDLADLLGHSDVLKSTDLFKTTNSPSRSLLNFALANGDTVLQIRDFLENLDAFRAVVLIDNMVKLHF